MNSSNPRYIKFSNPQPSQTPSEGPCFNQFISDTSNNLDLLVPITLIIVVMSSGTFQFIQDIKSEKLMSSFSKFQPSTVIVIRDGKQIEILPEHLVIGDIILLTSGNKISCDIIIIESSSDLSVDNSSLTGESEPQIRSNKCTNLDVMNTENVVFFGTSLLKGKAKGIVYKTGDNTFLGQIAKTSFDKGNKKKSEFEKEIQHFVKMISFIAILIGLICIIFDISNGVSFKSTIVFAITIIVANIPEGLLPTVTLSLSLAAYRMNANNVLIRNLQSIETLGCVSVICSDKTGTITSGKMSVSHVYVTNNDSDNKQNVEMLQSRKLMQKIIDESYSYFKLFRVAILCNNAHVELNENNHKYKLKGYPTETGILRASIPIIKGVEEINKLKNNYPIAHEIPFNS
eukprot:423743_1